MVRIYCKQRNAPNLVIFLKGVWDGDRVPRRKDMGPVEVLWDGDGVAPPPHECEQTENITSHRTSYAGGKNICALAQATDSITLSKEIF